MWGIKEALFTENNARYTATQVLCGWAGAILEVTRSFEQDQCGPKKKVKCDRPTDLRTDKAGCRVACTRLKICHIWLTKLGSLQRLISVGIGEDLGSVAGIRGKKDVSGPTIQSNSNVFRLITYQSIECRSLRKDSSPPADILCWTCPLAPHSLRE